MLQRPAIGTNPPRTMFVRSRGFTGVEVWVFGDEGEQPTPNGIVEAGESALGMAWLDESRFAVVSKEGDVAVWSVDDGEPHPLPKQSLALKTSVSAMASHGSMIALGDEAGQLWLLREESSGWSIGRVAGHRETVDALEFSSDGALLASASRDRTIAIWDAVLPPVSELGPSHSEVLEFFSVAFDAMHHLEPSPPETRPAEPPAAIGEYDDDPTVDMEPPQGLVSNDDDPTKDLDLEGVSRQDVLDFFSVVQEDPIQAAALEKTPKLGDAPKPEGVGSDIALSEADFSEPSTPSESEFGTRRAGREPVMFQFDEVERFDDLEGWAIALAFSPDGKKLASGGMDNGVYLWDLDPEKDDLIAVQFAHSGWVGAVAFSPDQKFVASGSWDSTVGLFDASTLEPQLAFEFHRDYVVDLAFTSERSLYSASYDGLVAQWDLEKNKLVRVLDGHFDWVQAVVSLNGGEVLSVSTDGTIAIWPADGETWRWRGGKATGAEITLGQGVDLYDYVDEASRPALTPSESKDDEYRDFRSTGFAASSSGKTALGLLSDALDDESSQQSIVHDSEADLIPDIHDEPEMPATLELSSFGLDNDRLSAIARQGDDEDAYEATPFSTSNEVTQKLDAEPNREFATPGKGTTKIRALQPSVVSVPVLAESDDIEDDDAVELDIPEIGNFDSVIATSQTRALEKHGVPIPTSRVPSIPAPIKTIPAELRETVEGPSASRDEVFEEPEPIPDAFDFGAPGKTEALMSDAILEEIPIRPPVPKGDAAAAVPTWDEPREIEPHDVPSEVLDALIEQAAGIDESVHDAWASLAEPSAAQSTKSYAERLESQSEIVTAEEDRPALPERRFGSPSLSELSVPDVIEPDPQPTGLRTSGAFSQPMFKRSGTEHSTPTVDGRPPTDPNQPADVAFESQVGTDPSRPLLDGSEAEDDDDATYFSMPGGVASELSASESEASFVDELPNLERGHESEEQTRQVDDLVSLFRKRSEPSDESSHEPQIPSRIGAALELEPPTRLASALDSEPETRVVSSAAFDEAENQEPTRINEPQIPTGLDDAPSEVTSATVNEIWSARAAPTSPKMGIVRRRKPIQTRFEPYFTIRTPHEWVYGVALSPSGKLIASCGGDDTLCVWETTGKLRHKLRIDSKGLNSVVFSHDGRVLCAAGDDGKIHIWLLPDRDNDQIRYTTLKGHDVWVTNLDISADTKHLVSAGYDGSAKVWELQTGECLRTLRGHTGPVTDVALGTKTYTAGSDGTIRVWNDSWTLVDQYHGFDKLTGVCAHGTEVCFTAANGDAYVIRSGQQIPLQQHRGEARDAFVRGDGVFATIGEDGLVMFYDPKEDVPFAIVNVGVALWSVAFDQNLLATGGDDGRIHLYRRR